MVVFIAKTNGMLECYQQESIEKWLLSSKKNESPTTRDKLFVVDNIPNFENGTLPVFNKGSVITGRVLQQYLEQVIPIAF